MAPHRRLPTRQRVARGLLPDVAADVVAALQRCHLRHLKGWIFLEMAPHPGEKLVFSMKHPEFSMEYGDFFLRNLVKNHRLVKQKPIQQAKLEI